eukprot:Ihof_evm1s294 gene=Ihof_evmTU1s294
MKDNVVDSCARCLNLIGGEGTKYPLTLPIEMSGRFRTCTLLAQGCQKEGYTGDIGYHSFLYLQEKEVRRLLMWLVERLPKEKTEDELSLDPTDILHRKIADSLTKALSQATVMQQGISSKQSRQFRSIQEKLVCELLNIREGKSDWTSQPKQQSYDVEEPGTGHLNDFNKTIALVVATPTNHASQSRSFDLWQALNNNYDDKNGYCTNTITPINLTETKTNEANHRSIMTVQDKKDQLKALEHKMASCAKDLTMIQNLISKLKGQAIEVQNKIITQENTYQMAKDMIAKGSNDVLNLKPAKENPSRLEELSRQWLEHRCSLVDQLKYLKNIQDSRLNDIERCESEIHRLNKDINLLGSQLENKEKQTIKLKDEVSLIKGTIRRKDYTDRIYEMIGSLSLQQRDLTEIIRETRNIEVDLKKKERLLEKIFMEARTLVDQHTKSSSTAKETSTLVIDIHKNCDQSIQTVKNINSLKKDCLDLEEQID